MGAHFHVITGGPGSGKTTIVEALARRGIAVVPEAGRAIIRQQRSIGGTAVHDGDAVMFRELMLARMIDDYERAAATAGPVVFDRGIPGLIGYCRLIGVAVPAHVRRAAAVFPYSPTVFVTPPWPEIYVPDAERRQDHAEAVRTFETVVAGYREADYSPVEVPRAPVEARVAFVLSRISSGG